MSFHEIRFPTSVSLGAEGGPERRTEIVTLSNGAEERNTPWAHSRRRYDAGLGLRSLDDLADVIAFFEARRGQLHGFRWRDWSDWKSCKPGQNPSALDSEIGTGDGTTTAFQLIKTYVSGAQSYARPIAKPVEGTVLVAVGGVPMAEGSEFSVDHATGVVALAAAAAPGARITAGFEFDVPVRFDTDRISASVAGFSAGEIPSIPVIEVRT